MTSLYILAFFLALGLGFYLATYFNRSKKRLVEVKVAKLMSVAKSKVKFIESELDEFVLRSKRKTKTLDQSVQENCQLLEKRVKLKTNTLAKRESKNSEKNEALNLVENEIAGLSIVIAQKREMLEDALSNKAGFTVSAAKEELMTNFESDLAPFYEQLGNKYVENCKESAPKEAVHLLKLIIQKYSEPSSVDKLDKTLKVKHDILKGRLIGRGAKNLVYLEEKTGADIIFEDQEGIITVSCFNLVIQETVRIAISKLLTYDKIDPENIDKALLEAKTELDKKLEKIGLEAADIIGIENRDPELMKLIGRLKYRTSYGQNILYHSMEIAYFSALMAAEIGADVETAKIGGFFHDIGKAIDQEVEGSHDYLGKEILEKFGYSWEVVHAAWTHHDAIPIETVEAQIVKAADAISAGRPGARTESAQMYIERIQGLERIAFETEGVKKAFALSAGRELRTLVDERKITDADMQSIADKMATKIESELAYPGRIKVNLIRTVEAVDVANKNAPKNNS